MYTFPRGKSTSVTIERVQKIDDHWSVCHTVTSGDERQPLHIDQSSGVKEH